jgi:hypothetical protein
MGQILKSASEKTPLNLDADIGIKAWAIPGCRTINAIDRLVQKNFLIRVENGLGDQACTEPAIRFALKRFTDCKISVESLNPSLFQHLPLHGNFHIKDLDQKTRDHYFNFQAMFDPDHLAWEFICHMTIHCVNYPALNMWRSELPMAERNIVLVPNDIDQVAAEVIDPKTDIVIHPGRNWQSKTPGTEFWNEVINRILSSGARPVIIGGGTAIDQKRSTSDVNVEGCLDLRDLMSPMETTAVLQKAKVILTNDSGPLHLAASGHAWIGFISTVKHPDYITHWRVNPYGLNEYGWRMESLGLGGMYEILNFNPNHNDLMIFDKCDPDLLKSWLPNPMAFADWGLGRLCED